MSHELIHEHLLISARRWARTAVDAFLEEPIDQDFAVHHMAVAVEHASKAYLASIAPVLLASGKQPSVDVLLVLSGNEGRTRGAAPGSRPSAVRVPSAGQPSSWALSTRSLPSSRNCGSPATASPTWGGAIL